MLRKCFQTRSHLDPIWQTHAQYNPRLCCVYELKSWESVQFIKREFSSVMVRTQTLFKMDDYQVEVLKAKAKSGKFIFKFAGRMMQQYVTNIEFALMIALFT